MTHRIPFEDAARMMRRATDEALVFAKVARDLGHEVLHVDEYGQNPSSVTGSVILNGLVNGVIRERHYFGDTDLRQAHASVVTKIQLTGSSRRRSVGLVAIQTRFHYGSDVPLRVVYLHPRAEALLRDYFDLREWANDTLHWDNVHESSPAIRLDKPNDDRFLTIAMQMFELFQRPRESRAALIDALYALRPSSD